MVPYKGGKGIAAYGVASGKLEKADCDGPEDYEYYMELNKFVELTEPISAARMKELTNQGFPFRTTMYSISEDATKALIAEQ